MKNSQLQLRIGIDAKPLRGSRGGIFRYTTELIRALARLAPKDELILYGRPSGDVFPEPNVRWSRLQFPFKRWVDQVHLLGASREIDLFHGTNYFLPLAGAFPAVVTIHDLTVELLPTTHPRLRRADHALLPMRCRRAARVIVPSRSTKTDAVRVLGVPEERIEVIPQAVSTEFRPVADPRERERVRQRYGLPASFVLFVGAIEPRKNLPALVRAVAPLRRTNQAPPLVIGGTGDPLYVERLLEIVRESGLEQGRDVIAVGHIEDSDLPAVYSLCEVFVYPSVYEGFGFPPLEAMACGAPVVVLDNSSLRELYAGCSLVAREADLGRAIRALLADRSLRKSLVERGLKRAKTRTWDDVAAQTLEVYRAALAKP